MKEKKNSRAKKILLMGISCVLVAAISVSATLAYLTAKTNDKDNKFTASGGITGEVIEPNYEYAKTLNWKPGEEIQKNPMVDNDTANYDVWVGASIEYQLSVDGTDYVTVPYSVFSQYVTVTGKVGNDWVVMNATDHTKDYYFYNKRLTKQTTETEQSYSPTTSFGTTGSVTSDNTTELFTKVTPKANLDISPNYATTASPGYYVPMYQNGNSMVAKTLVTANANIPTTNVNLDTLAFNSFNFKIKITGYGIKNDSSVGGGNLTELSGDTLADVKSTILVGLGTTAES